MRGDERRRRISAEADGLMGEREEMTNLGELYGLGEIGMIGYLFVFEI